MLCICILTVIIVLECRWTRNVVQDTPIKWSGLQYKLHGLQFVEQLSLFWPLYDRVQIDADCMSGSENCKPDAVNFPLIRQEIVYIWGYGMQHVLQYPQNSRNLYIKRAETEIHTIMEWFFKQYCAFQDLKPLIGRGYWAMQLTGPVKKVISVGF